MVSRHIVRSSSIVLMGAVFAAPATAQFADGELIRLAPISVTATRNPIRAFEYPGMVTVIGRDQIRAAQPSNADDVLRSVPNVEFTGGPRRTGESPSIRGFDGADVIILLDGARQNFGSTHEGRFFLDPSLLREVEVLRGPASSLYGSGGTGGVIEFRSEDVDTGPAGELLKRDVDTTGFRIDSRSRLHLSDRIAATFTYGGELYRDTQNGAAGAGERDGVPDADADFLGGFIQAEIGMSELFGVLPGDVLLIPGARFDRFETTSTLAPSGNKDSEFSPKIGASYLPTDWLLLFASYADAFRAPTSNESYLTGTHFTIPLGRGLSVVNRFVPNPDLRSQRTSTVEVGSGITIDGVFTPGDRLEFKAAHFHTAGEDFIDLSVNQPDVFGPGGPNPACFRPGACDGTTNSENVANATLRGVEIEGSYESRRTRVELGFSTLDGEDDDTGEKLGVLTPPQLHLGAALKLPAHDTVVGWRVHAAAEFDRANDPDERRAGYAVHDFYLAWAPSQGALRGLRLDLGIDNAFDRDYDRVFTGATEVGRNFKAALTYERRW